MHSWSLPLICRGVVRAAVTSLNAVEMALISKSAICKNRRHTNIFQHETKPKNEQKERTHVCGHARTYDGSVHTTWYNDASVYASPHVERARERERKRA